MKAKTTMRYKVTIENLVDPTDRFTAEADAAFVFMGQVSGVDNKFQAGMGYAGHKGILAAIVDTIPAQLTQFAAFVNQTEEKKENKIILPNGKGKNLN